jgi:hypothetical protein
VGEDFGARDDPRRRFCSWLYKAMVKRGTRSSLSSQTAIPRQKMGKHSRRSLSLQNTNCNFKNVDEDIDGATSQYAPTKRNTTAPFYKV